MRRICATLACAALLTACTAGKNRNAGSDLRIHALKYGESLYPAHLVNTDSREKNVRLNWLAYLVEHANGKRTLVDCGFSEPKLLRRFGIEKFRAIPQILRDMGIAPEKIDTVILTHTHFDHALDADKYPNAQIIVHKNEFDAPEEPSLKKLFPLLKSRGKILAIAASTGLDGLRIEPVMGHTRGSLAVYGLAAGREVVFTGDECYFALSCRRKIPLPAGAVFSTAANRRFIESLGPETLILTGHETDLTDGSWVNSYVFLFFFR